MKRWLYYGFWAAVTIIALLYFYQIGQSAYYPTEDLPVNSTNLSNLPTSTPRPQIFRFIQEAMKRRPRPTLPPEDAPGNT